MILIIIIFKSCHSQYDGHAERQPRRRWTITPADGDILKSLPGGT